MFLSKFALLLCSFLIFSCFSYTGSYSAEASFTEENNKNQPTILTNSTQVQEAEQHFKKLFRHVYTVARSSHDVCGEESKRTEEDVLAEFEQLKTEKNIAYKKAQQDSPIKIKIPKENTQYSKELSNHVHKLSSFLTLNMSGDFYVQDDIEICYDKWKTLESASADNIKVPVEQTLLPQNHTPVNAENTLDEAQNLPIPGQNSFNTVTHTSVTLDPSISSNNAPVPTVSTSPIAQSTTINHSSKIEYAMKSPNENTSVTLDPSISSNNAPVPTVSTSPIAQSTTINHSSKIEYAMKSPNENTSVTLDPSISSNNAPVPTVSTPPIDQSATINHSSKIEYAIKSTGVICGSGLSFVIAHKIITPWIVKKMLPLIKKTRFSASTKARLVKATPYLSTGIITILGGTLSLIPSSLLINLFLLKK